MSHTITLDLPDSVFQPVQRTAAATNQPIEVLLVQALQASLPPLEGLPGEVIEQLTVLETWDDTSLWRVLGETVPAEVQRALSTLLARQQAAALTETEREQLALLQQQAVWTPGRPFRRFSPPIPRIPPRIRCRIRACSSLPFPNSRVSARSSAKLSPRR